MPRLRATASALRGTVGRRITAPTRQWPSTAKALWGLNPPPSPRWSPSCKGAGRVRGQPRHGRLPGTAGAGRYLHRLAPFDAGGPTGDYGVGPFFHPCRNDAAITTLATLAKLRKGAVLTLVPKHDSLPAGLQRGLLQRAADGATIQSCSARVSNLFSSSHFVGWDRGSRRR